MERTLKRETDLRLKSTQNDNKKLAERTVIRKWGNSQGIRIPRSLMNEADLSENDTVELSICDGKVIIEKVDDLPKYLNLKERLEAFYNRPIDEIFVESSQEVDTGAPVGNEIW